MTPTSNGRGILFMLAAGALFVANDSLIKFSLKTMPAMELLTLRGLFATLWCLIAVAFMGQLALVPRAFHPWVVLRSLFEVVAIFSFITALRFMPIGNVTAIYQVAPLLVVGGAFILWHEPVSKAQLLCICGGLLGGLLVAQPAGASASPALLLPFLTALGAASRDLASRKVPADTPGLIVGLSTIVIVLIISALVHVRVETWVPPDQFTIAAMALAGVLVLLAQTFIFLAYRYGTAAAVAPFGYCLTGWAVLAGYAFFGEKPNAMALGGMALVIFSGLFAIMSARGSSVAVKMKSSEADKANSLSGGL